MGDDIAVEVERTYIFDLFFRRRVFEGEEDNVEEWHCSSSWTSKVIGMLTGAQYTIDRSSADEMFLESLL